MRQCGTLLHITSLPSPGGIGDLGHEAYRFADFLAASGMRIWQVLPVCPTGFGESPYQSPSAFAGNPLLISPELLEEEGLLKRPKSKRTVPSDPAKVDYPAVREEKTRLLRECCRQSSAALNDELDKFRDENPWAEDYALFTALSGHFGEMLWSAWPDRDIVMRTPSALLRYEKELDGEIHFHLFCQYLFRRQWSALKKYCNSLGISVMGDMPIYTAENSADTWTHPEVFLLDKTGVPKLVGGVPPDYFSETGQLWGNPLYDWEYLKGCNYAWWSERLRRASELYDIIRIDHFIGFANYYAIRHGAENAIGGKWMIGPGRELFKQLKEDLPDLRIVAEDLGIVSSRVKSLLRWCKYPGMRVLLFGFDSDETNPNYPANYVKNSVVYTGTHDNDTVLGWYRSASEHARAFAQEAFGFETEDEAPRAFIRGLFETVPDTAIFPMQDALGLGTEARMNLPGTVGDHCWTWRMPPGMCTNELAEWLLRQARETGRAPAAKPRRK